MLIEEDRYRIQVRFADGTLVDADITLDPHPELYSLSLSFDGRRYVSVSAKDYFEALCDIRLQLEPEVILPVCYGASLTAYPSGRCRSLSGGITTYRLTFDRSGGQTSLVSTFSSGADVEPATVAEQRAFFETWTRATTTQAS